MSEKGTSRWHHLLPYVYMPQNLKHFLCQLILVILWSCMKFNPMKISSHTVYTSLFPFLSSPCCCWWWSYQTQEEGKEEGKEDRTHRSLHVWWKCTQYIWWPCTWTIIVVCVFMLVLWYKEKSNNILTELNVRFQRVGDPHPMNLGCSVQGLIDPHAHPVTVC